MCVAFVGCDGGGGEEDARAPTLNARVALELGVLEGDPAQEFGQVMNAVKLSDGRIAVADSRSTDVRVFGADGTHTGAMGRRGRGPGEIAALTRLWADSADNLTFGSATKIVRFDSYGEFLDEKILDWTVLSRPDYGADSSWPLHGDTQLVMLIESSRAQPRQEGLIRPGRVLLLATAQGEELDSIGYFPGVEQFTYRTGTGYDTAVLLFPAYSHQAIGKTRIVFGDLAADSVLLYEPRTRESRWLKVPVEPLPIDPATLDAAREAACEWASEGDLRANCEAGVARLPAQTHYPAMRDIAVDSAGHVWVSKYAEAAAGTVAEWLVLDDAGEPTARVLLPVEFRPTQIGDGYVLGITTDDLGVNRIVEFRIDGMR